MWSSARPWLALAAALLASCASLRPLPELLAPAQQEALLREMGGFRLQGRVGVQAGGKSEIASMSWTQAAEESAIRLSGPFGAGSLQVTWRPGLLVLESGRGERYEGADAEQVLLQELGFVPPFEALRYWILGLEAPGAAAGERSEADSGRIGELRQRQWLIRYERWMSVASRGGGVELPRRLTATREDLSLRVIVDEWELQAP